MGILNHILTLGVVLHVGACNSAAAQYTTKPYMGEHLVGVIPKGWTEGWEALPPVDTTEEDGVTTRFVPAGQTAKEWREMITVRWFPRGANKEPGVELEKFLKLDRRAKSCEHYQRGRIVIALQNNYQTAATSQLCGRNPSTGRGEVDTFKAISYEYGLDIVELAWSTVPFENTPPRTPGKADELFDWVNGVYLCNKSDPSRPCPEGR